MPSPKRSRRRSRRAERSASQRIAPTLGGDDTSAKEATSATLSILASCLRCPYCGAALAYADRALLCDRGHAFDVSRQGHVALLPPGGRIARGDSKEMVAARESFLGAGHYAPFATEVIAAAKAVSAATGVQRIVDLGAGTGYFLSALLRELPDSFGLALDSSRFALRRALRAHPRISAIYCDVWRGLPLQDEITDLAVNVFAPRNGPEIARVLAPGGALIVATPTPQHLHQLVSALGMLHVDADKQARLHAGLSPSLAAVSRRHVEFDMTLGRQDVQALVAMGPSAHHLNADDVQERLAEIFDGDARVTASVIVETFLRA